MRATRFSKALVAVNGAVPVALLAWDATGGRLGANPVNFAIRTTGLLSLIFLLLSLVVTPASRLTGWGWLGAHRRVLGLYGFFHAALHFFIFFAFDRDARVADTLNEITMRNYLMVGIFALLLMVPLAVTSTDSMVRRLGPRRWKRLHWLAYPIAIAAVLHFAMLVKADLTRPLAFAAALAVLLGYRVVAHYLQLRADSHRLRTAPPVAAARSKFWTGQLRVARVFDEAPGVKTFRFVATDGGRLPFDFQAGQYLNISTTIDGRRVARSYTIASPPSRVGYCEITVKREDAGTFSHHLHESVGEGAVLDVSAPAGRFVFTGKEADGIVMIAAGVGITPLMSKVRYLTDIGWRGPIDLIFSVRTADDVIFQDELAALARRFSNLRYAVTLSRGEPGGPWPVGRITAELLRERVPDIAARRVHFCGPSAMAEPLAEMLASLGVPTGAFFQESFTPRPRMTEDATTTTGSVEPATGGELTFQRSGKRVEIGPSLTVLEAAEEQGVSIDYDCRAAICGRCKVRLIEGEVVMAAEDALDPADRANGVILSCQARCRGPVVVDA